MIAIPAAIPFPGWFVEIATVAPVLTLLIAAAAIVPAWVAIFRNAASNREARWWSEAQWALSASFSVNPDEQKAGLRMLGILATATWLGEHEMEVLDAAYGRPLREISMGYSIGGAEVMPGRDNLQRTQAGLSAESTPAPDTATPPFTKAQREVHLEAARLKITLDGRLKRKTPQWIIDLANS